jgi:hypothetical protein
MFKTIIGETKREGQKKAKRLIAQRAKKKEKVSFSHGKNLFHPQPL